MLLAALEGPTENCLGDAVALPRVICKNTGACHAEQGILSDKPVVSALRGRGFVFAPASDDKRPRTMVQICHRSAEGGMAAVADDSRMPTALALAL